MRLLFVGFIARFVKAVVQYSWQSLSAQLGCFSPGRIKKYILKKLHYCSPGEKISLERNNRKPRSIFSNDKTELSYAINLGHLTNYITFMSLLVLREIAIDRHVVLNALSSIGSK